MPLSRKENKPKSLKFFLGKGCLDDVYLCTNFFHLLIKKHVCSFSLDANVSYVFQRLRARAPLNFDKFCKRRTYILYRKKHWKIIMFRLLRFLHFCFRNWFPCLFAPCFPLSIFDFLVGASHVSWVHFWSFFDGLGSNSAPKTSQKAFREAS